LGVDGVTFGRGFKALRVRRRLTQADLANAAGVSRGAIARIESGAAERVTVGTLERVARPLGARVTCRLSWNGEGLDRLLDAAHAEIVEQIVRIHSDAGWLVATEVSFNHFGERGSIDVLAFHQASRCLLVIEAKSVVPDVQATLVTLDRKARLGVDIARARGWHATSVGRLLVIRDERTARRRVTEHAATFGNAFPDRVARIRAWIRRPEAAQPLHGLWFLTSESQAVARQRVRRADRRTERGSARGF
jgi:transcriptional regulator with XRE-family HTH domain